MNPLDAPFPGLEFQLEDDGRTYRVVVERLCCMPLDEGLLEHSYMDPEELPEWLEDWRQEEIARIESFQAGVSAVLGRSEWTLLTPTPPAGSPEFQTPERLFGRLCAVVLRSFDAFPVPYRGEEGDEPADYAEACLLYVAGRSEGLVPESIRRLIRWEAMAKPRLV